MQQGGGSPYGAPPPPAGNSGSTGFDEMGAAMAAAAAGDELLGGGGGGSGGNRWPRQETLVLLKIRSEMDSAFKDATVKGPLWEDVSRKLGELGFKRSGKKCKEKFENVHKYYKRTKEGRAGRQDGKSYRFFNQLEALHTAASGALPTNIVMPTTTATTTTTNVQISAPTPITTAPPSIFPPGISFSSNTSSSGGFGSESDDEEDDEATEEGPTRDTGGGEKKRKREEKESAKVMAFLEGMMRQVMERQEMMQQKFLETIEKREQDRMIREEAWQRQELSRVAREHELATQERAAAACRDAAVISFLQNFTGQSVPVPASVSLPVAVSPVTPPAPPVLNKPKSKLPVVKESAGVVIPPPPPQQQQQQQKTQEQQTPSSTELIPVVSSEGTVGAAAGTSSVDLASSSRWPKSEIHALINLRSELDTRYQESGPKGPLWEEISAGMKQLGYNRSSKRCKEKWENINKYFKKVKESNKKRQEDAKTCPYFHQLDALYRSKQLGSHTITSAAPISVLSSPPLQQSSPEPLSQAQTQQTNVAGNNENAGIGGIGLSYGDGSGTLKKPEDTVKELMGQSSTTTTIDYGKLDVDGDNIDQEEDDDEEDDEDGDGDGDGKYRIQYQRPNVAGNGSNGTGDGGGGPSANGSSGKTSGSFLAMVR